jgi:hypothetical protein
MFEGAGKNGARAAGRRLSGAMVGIAAVLALAGCATPYQQMGITGGVRSVQIETDIAQITARGSLLTDADKIEQYVLRKAAETTLASGYDHFEVVSVSDRSRTFQAAGGYTGFTGTGFPSGGLTLPFIRPGETILIRMSRGPSTAQGVTVFDARDVLAHLGQRQRES